MSITVTKHSGSFVSPCKPTPSGILLLSSIDKIFSPGSFVERIFVFKQGSDDVAKVVRKALSKALVHYYPLAGRLMGSAVACTGDGVWFVDASVGCDLQAVDWLEEMPLKIPRESLISYPPNSVGVPILLQVTQFSCGGFVVGFGYDHAIADGVGMAKFMNAVAEISRGLENPTVEPIWCRDKAPLNPPSPPLLFTPSNNVHRYLYFPIDISPEHVQKLKDHFGHTYSSFEILAANLWQSRARAITIDLDPNQDLSLVFLANIRRHLLNDGDRYYGNCIFPLSITMPMGRLITASTVEVMNLIRDEKEKLSFKVSKWSNGEEVPPKLRLGNHLLFIGIWTWHGFEEVDFGWGKPLFVAPTMHNNNIAVTYFVKQSSQKKGVRLMTQCVSEEHLGMFTDQMMNVLCTP